MGPTMNLLLAVVLLAVASLVRRPLRVPVSTVATVVISGGALGVALWQWSDVQEHGAHTYVAQAVVMDGGGGQGRAGLPET